jgi:hypothetical protein
MRNMIVQIERVEQLVLPARLSSHHRCSSHHYAYCILYRDSTLMASFSTESAIKSRWASDHE